VAPGEVAFGEEVHAAPGIRVSRRSPPATRKPITSRSPSTSESISPWLDRKRLLVAGNVDLFRQHKMAIVGPTAANAALEGSKIHAKRFMQKLGLPTARFATAASIKEAEDALRHFRYPVVLKTDGLAAGKGVAIALNLMEVRSARNPGVPLVIEEFLEGEEVSFIALCDGRRAVALEPSQDHKRAFDGDQGPNTGGMGAYSDSRILSEADRSRIMDTVHMPVVRQPGSPGFLYAGLMITARGPEVLEFNVRLGDPETQPLMMRIESDWAQCLLAAARGDLRGHDVTWSPDRRPAWSWLRTDTRTICQPAAKSRV